MPFSRIGSNEIWKPRLAQCSCKTSFDLLSRPRCHPRRATSSSGRHPTLTRIGNGHCLLIAHSRANTAILDCQYLHTDDLTVPSTAAYLRRLQSNSEKNISDEARRERTTERFADDNTADTEPAGASSTFALSAYKDSQVTKISGYTQ